MGNNDLRNIKFILHKSLFFLSTFYRHVTNDDCHLRHTVYHTCNRFNGLISQFYVCFADIDLIYYKSAIFLS